MEIPDDFSRDCHIPLQTANLSIFWLKKNCFHMEINCPFWDITRITSLLHHLLSQGPGVISSYLIVNVKKIKVIQIMYHQVPLWITYQKPLLHYVLNDAHCNSRFIQWFELQKTLPFDHSSKNGTVLHFFSVTPGVRCYLWATACVA